MRITIRMLSYKWMYIFLSAILLLHIVLRQQLQIIKLLRTHYFEIKRTKLLRKFLDLISTRVVKNI